MMKAYAFEQDEFRVDHVTLYKIYNRDRHMEERRILIRGKYLKDAPVGIITSEGYKPLPRPTVNQETILQYDLKEDEVGDILRIGSVEIQLDEGLMPTLSQVSRKVESDEGVLTLKGSNLDAVSRGEVRAFYEHMGNPIELPSYEFNHPTEISIGNITGALG